MAGDENTTRADLDENGEYITLESSVVELMGDGAFETDPRSSADEAKPLALKWVSNAILVLNSCIRSLVPGAAPNIHTKIGLPIVRLHFHTDRLNSGQIELDAIKKIDANFQTMRRYLLNSDQIFCSVDDQTASRETLGYFYKDGPPVGSYTFPMRSICFTSHFPTLGPNCKAAVIIHQLAHFIDARVKDLTGNRGAAYDRSTFETALLNVHCYPNFAINATPPYVDERYGMMRPAE